AAFLVLRVGLFGGALAGLFGFGLALFAGEFDYRKRGGVAAPEAVLDDAGIAAVAVLEARRDLVKELFDGVVRAHEGVGAPPRGQIVLLSQRHHPIRDAPELLRLGIGRADSSMADERQHEVLKKRLPMRGSAVELSTLIQMTHRPTPAGPAR